MIILKPTDSIQTIKFIGRDETPVFMSFRDDQTNITLNFDISGSITFYPNYTEIAFGFDKTTLELIEGRTYDFKVSTVRQDVTYRDKIYVSAQDETNQLPYSYSEGNIKEHSTNNEYTIYE